MHVALESPDQPEVIALIAELDAYQDTLYPPESRHALDLASLKQANVLFVVARDADQQAVGCGAVVLQGGHGELKRMYVRPECRGQGVARAVLALLETQAAQAGCTLVQLETGPYQPEALALYARSGYQRCGPFGGYWDDPLSVFMQKQIGGGATPLEWSESTDGLDWDELVALYRAAPLGKKNAEGLKVAFGNSMFKCLVREGGQLVGVGRALADGTDCAYLCDIAVLPRHQGTGLGKAIVSRLLALSAGHRKIILYAVPGKEPFYRQLGFRRMCTAMAIFEDQAAAAARGYIQDD